MMFFLLLGLKGSYHRFDDCSQTQAHGSTQNDGLSCWCIPKLVDVPFGFPVKLQKLNYKKRGTLKR